jgi:hypothetical protein
MLDKALGCAPYWNWALLCLAWAIIPVKQVAVNKGPTPLPYTFRRCANCTMIYIYIYEKVIILICSLGQCCANISYSSV